MRRPFFWGTPQACARTVIAVCVPLITWGCQQEPSTPPYVDIAQVSEALRQAHESQKLRCDGFDAYVSSAAEAVEPLKGASRYAQALKGYTKREAGSTRLDEPALFRLALQSYAHRCIGPESARALERAAHEVAEQKTYDQLADHLRELLSEPAQVSPHKEATVIDLPGESPNEEPLQFFACLDCPGEGAPPGPAQVSGIVGAIQALLHAPVTPRRAVSVVICHSTPDCFAEKANAVWEGQQTICLDGTEPLLFARFGKVGWTIVLPHRPLAATFGLRPQKGGPERGPLVLDVGSDGEQGKLPHKAWMKLADAALPAQELASRVEQVAAKALEGRESHGRYEVAAEGNAVVVTAISEPAPLLSIRQRKNALWDLAALADALDVRDIFGGGGAAMLRVALRFDGDPHGGRLGLFYEDPGVGPLLVAPTALKMSPGEVSLTIEMHRPPGLPRKAFAHRLDDALARLRVAARGPLDEQRRTIEDPVQVDPQSPQVRTIARSWLSVMGQRVNPRAYPEPGLSSVFGGATLGIPASDPRTTALLTDILWQMAVADPQILEESLWQ